MSRDRQKQFDAGLAKFLREQLSAQDEEGASDLSVRDLTMALKGADVAVGFIQHCARNGPMSPDARKLVKAFLGAVLDSWADYADRAASPTTTETLQ